MKKYSFVHPFGDLDQIITMTEEEILEDYWDHWNERMIKKYGYGHHLITKENCIEDWAYEV